MNLNLTRLYNDIDEHIAHIHDYIFAFFAKPQAAAELTFVGLSGLWIGFRFEKKRRKEFRQNQLVTLKLPVYEFLLNQIYVTQSTLDKRIRKIFNEYNKTLLRRKDELRKQYPQRSYQMAWAQYRGIDPLNPRLNMKENEDSDPSTKDSKIPLEDVKLIFRASGRLSRLLSDYIDDYGYTVVALEKLEAAFSEENDPDITKEVSEDTKGDKLMLTDYVRLVTWCAMSTNYRFSEMRVQIYSEIARVFPKESRSDVKQNRNLEKAFEKGHSAMPDVFKVLEEYKFPVAPRRSATDTASIKRFRRTRNVYQSALMRIKRSYKWARSRIPG